LAARAWRLRALAATLAIVFKRGHRWENDAMDVHILGSINVDTILSVDALPAAGETVLAAQVTRLPGGKGANQAVAAARMGARVSMTGAVGADADGDWMRAVLKGEEVDVRGIATLAGVPTGVAMIAVDAAGENQIIVAPGANALLAPEAAPKPGLTLAQLEIPLDTIASAFAASAGPRLLNAAPFIPAARALFAHTDLLIVNQHELAGYADVPAISGPAEAIAAARALRANPQQQIVVTLGGQGAVAVFGDAAIHAPALSVTPRDTVGAGDCFCGAMAALIAGGMDLAAVLPLANAAAALCTQTAGAIPAMPARAAVMAALAG
jgi:ribokinase